MSTSSLLETLRRVPIIVPLLRRIRWLVNRILGTGPRIQSLEEQINRVNQVDWESAARDAHRISLNDTRITHNEKRLDDLERGMPQVLNAIGSFGGVARRMERRVAGHEQWSGGVLTDHAESINDLWKRLETIRRELMVELRYSGARSASPAELDQQVISPDQLAIARAGELPVNLGCGHLVLDGYLNVDMRELPGVDVVAPVTRLPVEENELSEIYSAHLVEHFPQEELERVVLPYWISLLRPGGVMRMTLPDSGSMLDGYAAGEIPWSELKEVLYGGQEYEGDFHFNMYSAETLSELLRSAGLVDVQVEVEGERNGACLEMRLSAHKPG